MMANSLEQLKTKIADVNKSTEAQGLEIHPGKTKILTNQNNQVERNRDRRDAGRDTSSRRKSEVFGADDHIRGPGNHRGPMRLVRVRQTSTGSDIPILLTSTRLHLFNAVVTPTITYGAGTWATTKEHEKMLRAAQRRTLRPINSAKQRTTPWVGTGKTNSRLQRGLCQRWRGRKRREGIRNTQASYDETCDDKMTFEKTQN